MTPYAATKIINEILKGNDLAEIPPQMVYNYCGKGYIKASKVNGKWQITEEDLMTWGVKYLGKRGIAISTETTEVEGQMALEV